MEGKNREQVKPYRKSADYSYTLGAFPTIELIKSKTAKVREVFVHSTFTDAESQIVLVNPSNMGNLGTILRTAVGFGIYDIALISPAVDVFNPKVVRSSMGALFRLRHKYFDNFKAYRAQNKEQEVFTFMLNGKKPLTVADCPKPELFTLVFGNEATGLDDMYLDVGTSVIIPQSPDVDSLNLTIAVGIGTYLFTQARAK